MFFDFSEDIDKKKASLLFCFGGDELASFLQIFTTKIQMEKLFMLVIKLD